MGADAERAAEVAAALGRLDEITRRLRRECPWDRVQDERSIVPHTVEESYELAEAAGSGDDEKLLDELGDVLFQVHFLSLLLEERGAGDLAAVASGTTEKLIRRHPHVFGETRAENEGEVRANWERIKREQEGRMAAGPFSDVPENLPGPLYARKLLRRAVSAGLPGPGDGPEELLAALEGRLVSLRELLAAGATGKPGGDPGLRAGIGRELGETLLELVDLARVSGVDPELELRAAAERMRARAERE